MTPRDRARLARHADTLIALGVASATLLVLVTTASAGFTRDEGYYFRAAREYHAWFEVLVQNIRNGTPLAAFADETLRRAFGYNTEHPGFVKLLMGFTWRIFHDGLGLVAPSTGYRLGPMLMVSAGNGGLYLLGRAWFDRRVGLLAAALLLVCPHVFYHSHLAAFDGPMMAMAVLSTLAFWRALDARRWIIPAGLLFGVALATKHNAMFFVPTFLLAYLLGRVRQLRIHDAALQLPPLPWVFVSLALLGPLVLYLTYPFGWHDPVVRLGAYYNYHLHHEHYPVDWFGNMLLEPPFPITFPFVMSALTIPLTILVPGVVGVLGIVVRALRELVGAWKRQALLERDPVGLWLLVLCTLVPPLIIAHPNVPIFGGTKHWMTMMPFFCLLAASVIMQAASALHAHTGRAVAGAAVVFLTVGFALADTVRTRDFGHTYFNELAPGHQGAAAMRLPRTFWGGDARPLLPHINAHASRGAGVFTHRMNYDSFLAYQREGLLRADLRFVTSPAAAEWSLINHQREYEDSEYEVWDVLGHQRPIERVAFDDVPIASLYDMRKRAD